MPGHVNGHATAGRPRRGTGVLIALEGGEGAGKTTQARLLAIWLRDQGYDVVATHEPGATKVGMRLRARAARHGARRPVRPGRDAACTRRTGPSTSSP